MLEHEQEEKEGMYAVGEAVYEFPARKSHFRTYCSDNSAFVATANLHHMICPDWKIA